MASEALASNLFAWTDAAGNSRVLNADVVLSASDTRTATLTDHVVEDGSTITDHVVIQPESLSLNILVTQTPIVSTADLPMEPSNLDVAWSSFSFEQKNYPLEVRQSQFKPGGFLLLSTAVRGAVTAVADAALNVVGLGSSGASAVQLAGSNKVKQEHNTSALTLQPTGSAVDRVTAVHTTLVGVMNSKLPVQVSFKGRIYNDYLITQIQLEESEGKFGSARIKLDLRAFRTVSATTVELPDPADFRAQPKSKGGKKKTTDKTDEATKVANKGKTGLKKIGLGLERVVDGLLTGASGQ